MFFDGVLMLSRPQAAYWGRLALLVVVAVLVGGLSYISWQFPYLLAQEWHILWPDGITP